MRGPGSKSAVKRILARVVSRSSSDRIKPPALVRTAQSASDRRTQTFAWLRPLPTTGQRLGNVSTHKALAFLRLASIRLMLRKLCNPA